MTGTPVTATETSAERFTGIPLAALDFYEDLEADNSKAFWTAHKSTYDTAVRRPFELLTAALAPEFGVAKIFRPYRDVRFAKDKTPYKDHQGAVVEAPGSGALYLQIEAGGLFVAGGMWQLGSDQVQRFRRAVDDDVPGSSLDRVLAALGKAGMTVGGDQLTRVPSGFAKDHPRAELLRRKSLTTSRHFGCADWLATEQTLTEVARAWRTFGPLNAWLAQHVGKTNLTGR